MTCSSISATEPVHEAITIPSLAQGANPIIQPHLPSLPCPSQICHSTRRSKFISEETMKPTCAFKSCTSLETFPWWCCSSTLDCNEMQQALGRTPGVPIRKTDVFHMARLGGKREDSYQTNLAMDKPWLCHSPLCDHNQMKLLTVLVIGLLWTLK